MGEESRNLKFEEAVERLEAIVTAMEAGSLPLDECLKSFEQAVALSRQCAAQLEAAERQISVLTADAGLHEAPDLSWRGDS